MIEVSAAPTLVVGLGCQKGCPVTTLRALLDQVLAAHQWQARQEIGRAHV